MNKKIFLTSIIALGFACPAMAEPTNTSSTFPDASQNQYMQEDYTYEGAATETNMAGVYQDNATVYANARYHDAVYALARGKYLPANSETPIDCNQNGYFCAGDDNGVNYSSSAQGLTQCPTGYGNSGTGASADTDCYRTCTNNDVAHSTGTVNGGYYYGDNNQCEPTNCVNGWHVYQPTLATVIGTDDAPNYAYINDSGSFEQGKINTVVGSIDHDQAFYGITSNNTWAVYYGDKGMLTGQARCSSSSITRFGTTNTVPDGSGRYCYCNVTGYTPADGTLQSLSSLWAYTHGDAGNNCARDCAEICSWFMVKGENAELRTALLDASTGFQSGLASCAANTINISWDGATSAAVSANDAGSVTYGGDIKTPQSAIHVPGKVFDGWEFSTTAPVNPVTED